MADGTSVAYHSITSPLDSSVVSAVSKVVAVAGTSYVAPHLKDDVAFKNYLNSLPIETESYEVGNELSSQVGEILARDEVLKDQGYSLVDIAIEWLNSKQNPKTGTWDEKYDYHATNGLMKISCFYNDVGAEFPNAQVAVQSALYSMTTDEDPYNVCCVYNNWFTINNIISNLRRHGGADAEKKVAEVRALLYEQGAASIIATAKKLSLFKKFDGSFSYKQEYASFTSQSMPVCVPYTNEGDVNATDICIEGTLNNLFASFGLSKYKIPVLGKADAIEYLTILDKLVPHITKMADESENSKKRNKVILFTLAIAIHNLPEGIAAGVGFGTGDVSSALTLALAIALQNIPEGMVIISPMIAAGISPGKTFIYAALTGVIEIFGTFIGYFAVSLATVVLPFALALAGGSMIYVISDEIIPETHCEDAKAVSFSFLFGFCFMLVLTYLI